MAGSLFESSRLISKESAYGASEIAVSFSTSGVVFQAMQSVGDWLRSPEQFSDRKMAVLLLGQLEDEGFVEYVAGYVAMSWQAYYRLIALPEYQDSLALFGFPPVEKWRPSLSSRGALTDPDFAVLVSGWSDPEGQKPLGNVAIEGAVICAGQRISILPEEVWRTIESIATFRERPESERGAEVNRQAWGKIRSHAFAAGADMGAFLRMTVVLSPEKLRIDLRKGDVGTGNLVEIIPSFEHAPSRWLEFFDRHNNVPERYEIPDGAGLVHVVLSPEVQTVLREIRRMPGRRIAGERAEAFIRNPFATLGPDAAVVIDAAQFERARDDAGIAFSRFTVRVRRDENGCIEGCALLIEEAFRGTVRVDELRFDGAEDITQFLAKLDVRMASNAQCCHWEGYDLEILGDTPDQVEVLREALNEMRLPATWKVAEILDLSRYSERVEGFGIEKPYYSPFIARKNDGEGWFPENVSIGICYTPEGSHETIPIVLGKESQDACRQAMQIAQDAQEETVIFPGCAKPVPVREAEKILQILDEVQGAVTARKFDPTKPSQREKTAGRKGLVVKPNVETLDYEERRGALLPPSTPPILPSTLLQNIVLMDHQKQGVAWLQHLWRMSPKICRGALLADDMGLGKTIQLLIFMAAAIEHEPDIPPFLIVAPVSLLENWKEEITKFFVPDAMEVLTLYGSTLAAKRVSRKELDEELVQAGATRLLIPRWLGSAKIVLTTYETLRDLEFSLAGQRWSAMICDEAQKIKNPNALVTRAAKKQNARLKIACTGTPVENTLTDLWCLFDFVQPGLLGALKEFGDKYRKPIEAETEEEKACIEELRALIEPQKLRRTKAEVAKDLPKKIEVEACRTLPISEHQRAHYAKAIAVFRQREMGIQGKGLQSHLGLLQYLRKLCSDPHALGHISTNSDSIAEIEQRSPKMAWLLRQLREIEVKREKVIVFCEFRDLQRTLQRAISERFGFTPDVINGDTSADPTNSKNRQHRIKAFQQKPGFGVIVLSPLAVGFGVNIQAANHVVHFTRTWNPAKEDQATDRAYRIGQRNDVYVYYPVVVAPDFVTFDAKLDKLLDWKRELSADMLNGAGDVSLADFGDLESPTGDSAFGEGTLGSNDIKSLDPDAFEAFCAVLWSKQGYNKTYRTPRVGDGGVDIVAINGDHGILIQCKSSSVNGRELGWEGVKDVAAGSVAYAVRHAGVTFSSAAVTNQRFNESARLQANLLHVKLIEGEDLAKLVLNFPVTQSELASFLLGGSQAP